MAGFYLNSPHDCLLLGDVVTGFRAVVPNLHTPGAASLELELGISVTQPEYFAVTTPCCSVGNNQISIAPLVQINSLWMTNPYLSEDLTRINRKASGENFVPPRAREGMGAEQIQAYIDEGPTYGFKDTFVYAPHDLLRTYKPKNLSEPCGHWILEFGSAFRVNCKLISKNAAAPSGVKLLELAVGVRQELREKLADYYGRIPEEDRELLVAMT